MVQLIAAQARKARKDHHDDSAEFILEALDYLRSCGKLKFGELRAIAELKANNWKIKRGQVYTKQFNKTEGQTYTFKTLPIILKICIKYKLYGE